jgi:hypothetical protein
MNDRAVRRGERGWMEVCTREGATAFSRRAQDDLTVPPAPAHRRPDRRDRAQAGRVSTFNPGSRGTGGVQVNKRRHLSGRGPRRHLATRAVRRARVLWHDCTDKLSRASSVLKQSANSSSRSTSPRKSADAISNPPSIRFPSAIRLALGRSGKLAPHAEVPRWNKRATAR